MELTELEKAVLRRVLVAAVRDREDGPLYRWDCDDMEADDEQIAAAQSILSKLGF